MTPIIHNDGPVWLVGITWNAEVLAAFLAGWMPVNLVSYLGFLALFTYVDDSKWEEKVFSLRWMLGMTLVFLPWLASTFAYTIYVVYIAQPIKNRRARR